MPGSIVGPFPITTAIATDTIAQTDINWLYEQIVGETQEVDYKIYKNSIDSKFYSRYRDGSTSAGDTDLGTVIQEAIDTFTSRTKQLVIEVSSDIDGEITNREGVSGTGSGLHLRDYTTLVVNGTLTYVSDGPNNLIQNRDFTNATGGNTNIIITGTGVLNGNKVVATEDPASCIKLKYTDYATVSNLTMLDSSEHNTSFFRCNHLNVLNNTITNAGDDNISIVACSFVKVLGNTCDTTRSDYPASNPTVGSSNIEIESESGVDCTDVLVEGNICLNSSGSTAQGDGIHCIVDGAETATLKRITIANNIVRDCNGIGIDLSCNEASLVIEGCIIEGNQVFNAGTNGYKIARNKRSIITSNVLDGAGNAGLSVAVGCDQCVITSNSFSNMDEEGIIAITSSDLIISNNVIANPGKSGAGKNAIHLNTVDGYIVTGNMITDVDGFSQAWMRINGDINPSYRVFHDNHATGMGQTTGTPGIQGTLAGTVLGYNDSSVYESSNVSEA